MKYNPNAPFNLKFNDLPSALQFMVKLSIHGVVHVVAQRYDIRKSNSYSVN